MKNWCFPLPAYGLPILGKEDEGKKHGLTGLRVRIKLEITIRIPIHRRDT